KGREPVVATLAAAKPPLQIGVSETFSVPVVEAPIATTISPVGLSTISVVSDNPDWGVVAAIGASTTDIEGAPNGRILKLIV
ncbi:hypothetical protein CRG98_050343, partial [Punica granatum]